MGNPSDFLVLTPARADWQDASQAHILADLRDGNPADLFMPGLEGDWEIRQFPIPHQREVATHAIRLTLPEARIGAPPQAEAGTVIEIARDGPGIQNDRIVLRDGTGVERAFAQPAIDGHPLQMQLPSEPGGCELSYWLPFAEEPLAALSLQVGAGPARIDGPDRATIGATLALTVTGTVPDTALEVAPVILPEGGPAIVGLQMPFEPGHYEISHVTPDGWTIHARHAVEVLEADATLTAPAEAQPGGTVARGGVFSIGWKGRWRQAPG